MDFENSSCHPLLKSISGKIVYIKSYIVSWKCIYNLTTNKHDCQLHCWQLLSVLCLQIVYLCGTFSLKLCLFLSKTTQILCFTLKKKVFFRFWCKLWNTLHFWYTLIFRSLWDQHIRTPESSLPGRLHIYPVMAPSRSPLQMHLDTVYNIVCL